MSEFSDIYWLTHCCTPPEGMMVGPDGRWTQETVDLYARIIRGTPKAYYVAALGREFWIPRKAVVSKHFDGRAHWLELGLWFVKLAKIKELL